MAHRGNWSFNMTDLASKRCVPCEGGVAPLNAEATKKLLKELAPGWELAREEGSDRIRKTFTFPDFAKAMQFVNKAAMIAEREKHHPDLHIWYNKVLVVLWTRAAKGLTENDFILAANVDEI